MAGKFDVTIIGAGPGGYVAAIRMAQLGMKVAVIDRNPNPGGTCLNVGCIPSKTLLHGTELYESARKHGKAFGIDGSSLTCDLSVMMSQKEKTIAGFGAGIKGLFKKNKITFIVGSAKVVTPRMIEVAQEKGKEIVETDRIVIATGSAPVPLPFLPFDEKSVVSSTGALSLRNVPVRMVVVGAGVIGLELASVYRRLGAEVTIVEMLDRVAPGLDLALSKMLEQILTKQGLVFRLGVRVEKAERTDAGIAFTVNDGGKMESIVCDVALVAIGRKPYTEGLGLKEAGVELSDRGFIRVDDTFQTNVAGIYAIGDVIEGAGLAHRASEEGVALAELLAGRQPHVNYMAIPNIVYTYPEVAGVGLTEAEARDMQIPTVVGAFPMKANSRAGCTGDSDGIVKVVAEKASGRLLGLHIIAAHASEMIHEGVVLLEKQGTLEEIASYSHGHPTLSEAIKEAALDALGRAIHI